MKEIDFIPEWYRASQCRKRRYHHQYIVLGVIVTMMVSWSFVIGRHVEQVRADVEGIQRVFEKGHEKVNQGMLLEADIASLEHRVQVVESITPRTTISAVMAELSWLVQDNIVLSKLSLTNEVIEIEKQTIASPSGVVRMGSVSQKKEGTEMALNPTRTKVVLTGIAAKGSDAATLIARLETSDYFEQVSPVYTRAKKINDHDVTEFEIRCFVADYKIGK